MLNKKAIKITAICIVAALLVTAAGIGISYAYYMNLNNSHDTSGTAFSGKYNLDENGFFVTDIPKEQYLHEAPPSSLDVYDIRDFGASIDADYKTNRKAINDAIAEANRNGGGLVLVDGGDYICANIELKSNVTLRINANSSLVNIDYDTNLSNEWYKEKRGDDEADVFFPENGFIYAVEAENITIEGPGKICGQGATYCNPQEDSSLFLPLDTFNLKAFILEHRKRIMMGKIHEMSRYFTLSINECRNVTVRNIELFEAASWTCRMQGNDGLTFENVIINNNIRVANTDGIDIMGGRDTLIKNCFIATGDDAVCLKTDPGNEPVDGLTVENCTISSLANCFKIGTATYSDIKNVTVRNCDFFMPGIAGGYSGIAIEATDGGKVSDIVIENINMDHITSPLLIWLGYRNSQSSALENITVSGITAANCDMASAITGYKSGGETAYVKNVTLSDFYVTYREAAEDLNVYKSNQAYEGKYNMGGYPEITRVSHIYFISHTLSAYYDMPAYGLFVRYADGLNVNNFNVKPRAGNIRPLTSFDIERYKDTIKNLTYGDV